jgi:hypothetical protein
LLSDCSLVYVMYLMVELYLIHPLFPFSVVFVVVCFISIMLKPSTTPNKLIDNLNLPSNKDSIDTLASISVSMQFMKCEEGSEFPLSMPSSDGNMDNIIVRFDNVDASSDSEGDSVTSSCSDDELLNVVFRRQETKVESIEETTL